MCKLQDRLFRAKQGPLVESIAIIRPMNFMIPVKRGERVTAIRLHTAARPVIHHVVEVSSVLLLDKDESR
jgi:hypothetical protein